jgi:hypothetical protein
MARSSSINAPMAMAMGTLTPRYLPGRWVLIYCITQGIGQFELLFTALKLGMTASIASALLQTQVFSRRSLACCSWAKA